jgi:hypothetical protein
VKAFQEAIIKVRTVLGFLPCVHPLWLCWDRAGSWH